MMLTIFIFMNHSLSAEFILLFQTIINATLTSMAPNEKFQVNTKLLFTLMMIIPVMLIPLYLSDINLNTNELTHINWTSSMMESANKFINFPKNIIMTFLVIYLFATVKISSNMEGPLRQMN